tara:strand:+ start:1292 stop:1444 length:153 start_codon:yes stop_codon:yes gene_type:complete
MSSTGHWFVYIDQKLFHAYPKDTADKEKLIKNFEFLHPDKNVRVVSSLEY